MSEPALSLEELPRLSGVTFRHFRGAHEYAAMADVTNASWSVDCMPFFQTGEELARSYQHLVNCDLSRDLIMAWHGDALIAFARGFWWDELDGARIFGIRIFIRPAWRGKGVECSLLRGLETQLQADFLLNNKGQAGFYNLFATQQQSHIDALAVENGYAPVRYFVEMLCQHLDQVPPYALPDGLEFRAVTPDHYRAIWQAHAEAFADHWGASVYTEEQYQTWLADPVVFQPALWQVVWDKASQQIAGQVRTFVNHKENERLQRQRGYTEFISVRRPWRKQGLARAMIARSLQTLQQIGMGESALGADSENLSGATRIYEACGFRVFQRNTAFRKPLPAISPSKPILLR